MRTSNAALLENDMFRSNVSLLELEAIAMLMKGCVKMLVASVDGQRRVGG